MKLLKKYAVFVFAILLSANVFTSCEDDSFFLDPADMIGLWSEDAVDDYYTFSFRTDGTGSATHYLYGREDFVDPYFFTVFPETRELMLTYRDNSSVFYDILDLSQFRLVIRDQQTGITFYLHYSVYID